MHVPNHERLHEELYRAHWAISGGNKHIHNVIVALHDASRYSDVRAKLKPVIEQLELARDAADQAWKLAGNARTDLIRQTGCDGRCSDRASGRDEEDAELETEPT